MNTADVLLVLARLAIGCWLLWSVPGLARRHPGRSVDLGHVSVVIPARDESASLPALLRSIPDGPEVIVVDDHSSDDTASLARAGGARVIESAPLPDGWIGKSWACAQGAAAATGETLVFVDADVRFGEGGLAAVIGSLDADGGLVSVQPFHRPGGPVEHLAAIFNVVGFAGTDAASPLGRALGSRGAFGPVLATTRSDYDAIGGHEAVKSSVVDDLALASRYRDAGRSVSIAGGRGDVTFRMYREGFGQMVEGFTKNLTAGVRGVRASTTLLIVAWTTLLVQAAVMPLRALLAGGDLVPASVVYVAVAVQFWWMARRVGRFSGLVAATFPVSVVLFLAVFARSVVATARGSVSWRGRRVSTRQ